MPEFSYARGRVIESVQFVSQEMKDYESDYSNKTWMEYREDRKLQKLIDRTVENILTALIEIGGTILTEEGIEIENYAQILKKLGKCFGLSTEEQDNLAKLAHARNRLAHRYLNFRWQTIKMFDEQKTLIAKLLQMILEREGKNRLKDGPK